MFILRPGLRRPDHPEWAAHALYRPEVAYALRSAFARVMPGPVSPDEYLWACGDVAPWMGMPMAPRQRVRVLLVFAQAHEADGAYREALSYIDRALEVSARGNIGDDLCDLLLYEAKLYRARVQYRAAAEAVEASLALLRHRAQGDDGAIEPGVLVEALAQLADYSFFLGRFPLAEQLVMQVRMAAQRAPQRALDAAGAIWVQAHLDRLRGRTSAQGFPEMHWAIEIFRRDAPSISQGRILIFMADLYLDEADRLPTGPASARRAGPLLAARTYLELGERLAVEARDPPGRGMATLARVRYQRLRGSNSARQERIGEVLRVARRYDDHSLQAQGFTALGDELAAQGEVERALDCYRQTIGLLDGSDVPALGVLPRRKLLRAREMAVDDDWP